MSKKTRKNNKPRNKSRTYKRGGPSEETQVPEEYMRDVAAAPASAAKDNSELAAAEVKAAPGPATEPASNRRLRHMNATRKIGSSQPPVKEAPDLFVSFLCDGNIGRNGKPILENKIEELIELLKNLDIKKAMFVKENDKKTVGFTFNISYIKRARPDIKVEGIFEICQDLNKLDEGA